MAKKLILLMLVIPLVIMISLYATSETVSLAIDIAVTGVEVNSEKFLNFDIDDVLPTKIEYTVYPTNAANREVTFEVESYNDLPLASLDITDDGIVTPTSTGYARVNVVTNDGGFRDSVIVEVSSNAVSSIEITNKEALSNLYIGDTKKVETRLEPSEPTNKVLEYSSSNEDILLVDASGNLIARSRGTATITVSSERYGVSDSVDITVLNRDVIDISSSSVDTSSNEGDIYLSINTIEEYDESNLEIFVYHDNALSDDITTSLTPNDTGYVLHYVLNKELTSNDTYRIEVYFKLPSGIERSVSCNVNFMVDFDFSFTEDVISLTLNQTDSVEIIVTPSDARLSYNITSVDGIVATVSNNRLIVQATKLGVYNLNVSATYNNTTKSHNIRIVVLPRNINILESANVYGISNELVFGSGTNTLSLAQLSEEALELFGEYITLVPYANNNSVANQVTVNYNQTNSNYEITFPTTFTNDVTFRVELNYDGITKTYGEFVVKLVGNARNVSNYSELKEATNNKEAVVLKNSIKDFPTELVLGVDYREMLTTYDYQYYLNRGELQPTVNVLLDVYNTIYGNGYEINAHNVTYKYDEAVGAMPTLLFDGPLNFVGIGSDGIGAANVRAQDNIFVALHDNAYLNNVIVKSCDDVDDLTKLNYVGTTVELLGDNATISYSRISNGRTVLRAFGDEKDADKVCNLTINNSILSNAREFIIRMGSNKFKDAKIIGEGTKGTLDYNSLYLDENEKLKFPFNDTSNRSINEYYSNLEEEDKKTYDEKYIKTYVTLNNVALEHCGIFSIGLDSHFAGPALMGIGAFAGMGSEGGLLEYWKNLAKTSYGAKLMLENTVRIYDWKPLDSVDSSTLIDVNLPAGSEESILAGLRFDVAALVRELATPGSGYEDILYNDGNYKDYVHGGIAFFGGGYNYDIVEYGPNYNSYTLYDYQIGLDDVSSAVGAMGEALIAAAGNTDFYFLLCNSTSAAFTPRVQDALIASGEAYKFIYQS